MNESAFPIPLDDRPGAYPAEPGMTLRDYFAAKAMQGICAMVATGKHDPTDFTGRRPEEKLAIDAYAMADAMLKARQS